MKGPYCHDNYPPSLQSLSNILEIKYASTRNGSSNGFIAYYESLGPAPNDIMLFAASRGSTYYSEAVTFLMSPLVNIPVGGYCLSFSYSMRSNLRVKVTTQQYTATLSNWVVDGGRSFHHAVLPLPQGMYKILWETTDTRKDVGDSGTPYHRYLVTAFGISIHHRECRTIGKSMQCTTI